MFHPGLPGRRRRSRRSTRDTTMSMENERRPGGAYGKLLGVSGAIASGTEIAGPFVLQNTEDVNNSVSRVRFHFVRMVAHVGFGARGCRDLVRSRRVVSAPPPEGTSSGAPGLIGPHRCGTAMSDVVASSRRGAAGGAVDGRWHRLPGGAPPPGKDRRGRGDRRVGRRPGCQAPSTPAREPRPPYIVAPPAIGADGLMSVGSP